jgi:membrane associated rhomboid family serine protease/Flp pilus assembly protein TadD
VAICSRCGKPITGFSFGSLSNALCKDCRRANARAAALGLRSDAAGALGWTQPAALAVRAVPVVTYALIAINVLVYLAMGLSGASWSDPSIKDALRWGADFGPLTMSGQWWRLLTCVFVHFGIIHIGFNMWCLWALGPAVERFMGRWAFLLMYVYSGLAASLASDAWDPWRVSAGASGAIFGIAGAFVSYLLLKKTAMDPVLVKRNLRNMAIFIGYNLIRGAASFSVDNAAHVGGLVAGLALGAVLPPMIRTALSTVTDSSAVPMGAMPGIGPAPLQEQKNNRVLVTVSLGAALLLTLAAQRVHAYRLSVALYGQGVTAVGKGDLNAGASDLQRAADLDPQSLVTMAMLGELRLEQNNPAAAIGPLQQALSIGADTYDVRHNLALAHLGVGQVTAAMSEIQGVVDKEGDDAWRGRYILGVAAGEAGDYEQASTLLNQVLQSKPDFYEAQDALALFDARHGNTAEAASLYRSVLQTHPEDADATAGLKLLASSGKPNAAQWPQAPSLPYSKLAIKSEFWPLLP